MANPRSRNIDSARKDDRRRGTVEKVEIIAVHPHVDPFIPPKSGDIYFNCVDVQLIQRNADQAQIVGLPGCTCGTCGKVFDTKTGGCGCGSTSVEPMKKVVFYNVPVAQRSHGLFQGDIWTPRIGDYALMYWVDDNSGIIIFSWPSAEQEPTCRSRADDYDQEVVRKLCPWEAPEQDQRGNFIKFPNPKHPDCFKWWPKTRDSLTVFDCANGHNRAECDKSAPCNCLDNIISRTYIKNFSSCSPTNTDKPWRYKFKHNCGTVRIYDQDGTIHEENKTTCSSCGGSGCTGDACSTCSGQGIENCPTCGGCGRTQTLNGSIICITCGGCGYLSCPTCNGCGKTPCSTCGACGGEGKGHSHHYPTGTVDIHAGNPHPNKNFIPLASENSGVRTSVVHPTDTSVNFAWETIDFTTGAYLRILKSGEINIYSPSKIKLDAPIVEETHNNQIDDDNSVGGMCTHGACSCGGGGGSGTSSGWPSTNPTGW